MYFMGHFLGVKLTISALGDLLDTPGPKLHLPGEAEAELEGGRGGLGGAGAANTLIPHLNPAPWCPALGPRILSQDI